MCHCTLKIFHLIFTQFLIKTAGLSHYTEEIPGSWDTDFTPKVSVDLVAEPHYIAYSTGNLQGPSYPSCRKLLLPKTEGSDEQPGQWGQQHGPSSSQELDSENLYDRERIDWSLRPAPIGYGPLTLSSVRL